MKTTVEISDSLFQEVRDLSRQQQRSLRSLIEEGLRLVLRERRAERDGFRLRKATFGGEGLSPELPPGDWQVVRGRIYGGRGE